MGTSEKVNPESCYVTLIYNKLVSLDKDLKGCYEQLRTIRNEDRISFGELKDRTFNSIKYFQNEKRFWLNELKKYLNKLDY